MEFQKCAIMSGFRRSGHNYFLARTTNYVLVENLLASMLRIRSFLAHYTAL